MCYDGTHATYHGGLLATVADSVAWMALVTCTGLEQVLTTSDLHIRFLAPCETDVTAEARVIKVGRTLCPVHVELFDEQDHMVAVSQVTYFRLDKDPVQPSSAAS